MIRIHDMNAKKPGAHPAFFMQACLDQVVWRVHVLNMLATALQDGHSLHDVNTGDARDRIVYRFWCA